MFNCFTKYFSTLLGLTGLLWISSGSASPLHLSTPQGTVQIPQPPHKVAVFDLAALDNLNALGVSVSGLPQGILPPHLSDYGQPPYLSTGTLFEPDYAALKRLAPDLIIIGGRTSAAYDRLSQLAPVVDFSAEQGSFIGTMTDQLRLLGRIFDRQPLAEKKITALTQALKHTRQQFQGQKGLVIFAYQGSLVPHAAGERFGMFYELLGMKNTVKPASAMVDSIPKFGTPEADALHRQRLTQALQSDPDWLLVLDRNTIRGQSSTLRQRLLSDPAITATRAWKQGQVFYPDAPAWYLATGGYQGVMQTLDRLQQIRNRHNN